MLKISYNTIIITLALLFGIIPYLIFNESRFLDMDTLAINAALCMTVVIFQLIDRMSNPLIFLLSTYIVIYNSLRILTLIFFDDYSRTLEESGL